MDRYGACTYMFNHFVQMRKIIHNSSCHQKLSMMRRRRQNRDQQSVARNSDHKCMRRCISLPFHNDPNLKFELVRSENWRWDINKIMPKPVWQEKRRGRTLCSSCSCQKSLGRRRSCAIGINKIQQSFILRAPRSSHQSKQDIWCGNLSSMFNVQHSGGLHWTAY